MLYRARITVYAPERAYYDANHPDQDTLNSEDSDNLQQEYDDEKWENTVPENGNTLEV
jgi:hypothetical protein